MRYFEKVFDGQVLKWCVNGAELGGGKPTLLCLVSNETEAESCLSKLEPHCGEAQVTALILPGGILPETAVQSLVFEWQTTGIIDKCKLSLTASQSCADAAWRLISHLSHFFSAAAILGGHADPYEVRAAKFMPLKVYTFAGEDNVLADGKVLADAEKLVMSLRVTGSETVERTEINPENAWENVFADGEIVRWLLKQDRRTQLEVTWIKPGFWRIDDYFTATCYLIEGRDKALLIDTGMGEGDLLDTVKKLTRLPVEVAITHPHRDHMFRIDRFEKVYLHKNDVEKIREDENCFAAALSDGGKYPQLVPIDEGGVIDLGGGERLFERVARLVSHEWNRTGELGLVVGATYPDELAAVRRIAPDIPLLVPGIGAQGGDINAAVKAGMDTEGAGMVINSGRAILYASSGADWREAARRSAIATRDAINSAREL